MLLSTSIFSRIQIHYQRRKKERHIKDYELVNSSDESDKSDESDEKDSDEEKIHYNGSEFNALA